MPGSFFRRVLHSGFYKTVSGMGVRKKTELLPSSQAFEFSVASRRSPFLFCAVGGRASVLTLALPKCQMCLSM